MLLTTSKIVYVRMHGKGTLGWKYEYSETELAKWKDNMSGLPGTELYLYFNNDFQANAVNNCRRIKELDGIT